MREKVALYCDLNSIDGIAYYQSFSDYIQQHSYNTCIVYNTNDFLIQWIWNLQNWSIDDETFFQIGDINSETAIKIDRPHLDAVEKILSDIHEHTLYVIDEIAQIAYTHTHWPRDVVEKKLAEKWSAVFAV